MDYHKWVDQHFKKENLLIYTNIDVIYFHLFIICVDISKI